MTEKINIFSKGECLSAKEMMDYTYDRLSMKERNKVERHLIDCELCQDAMEGYSLVKDENKTIAINDIIKEEVSGKTEENFNWRRIAAIVTGAFLIGGGVYYFNNQIESDSPIVVNTPQNTDTLSRDTNVSNNSNNNTIAIESNNPKNGNGIEINKKNNSDGLFYAPEKDLKEDEGVDLPKSESAEGEETLENKNITSAGTAIAPVAPFPLTSATRTADKNTEEISETADKGTVGNADLKKSASFKISKIEDEPRAKRQAAPKEKANVTYKFDESIKMDSITFASVTIVNYYSQGMDYYDKSDYKNALASFKKVTKEMKEYEDARWYSALCELKLGENNKAKKLFEEISNGNGPYKAKAQDELKKLK